MSLIINITNPNKKPKEGDWIRIIRKGTEDDPLKYLDKEYHEPITREAPVEPTPRERLESVMGITVEELNVLLNEIGDNK